LRHARPSSWQREQVGPAGVVAVGRVALRGSTAMEGSSCRAMPVGCGKEERVRTYAWDWRAPNVDVGGGRNE